MQPRHSPQKQLETRSASSRDVELGVARDALQASKWAPDLAATTGSAAPVDDRKSTFQFCHVKFTGQYLKTAIAKNRIEKPANKLQTSYHRHGCLTCVLQHGSGIKVVMRHGDVARLFPVPHGYFYATAMLQHAGEIAMRLFQTTYTATQLGF